MIDGIDHIEIEASDAEEMVDFLKTLGFEEIRRTEHHGASYELTPGGADGPVFEIHTVSGEEVPGINHIAFAVDGLEEVTEELAEAEMDQLEGPRFIEKTGRTITNLRDPDGRRVQLVDTGSDGAA